MTLKMYTFSLGAHKKMWEREKKRENMNMRQEKNPTALWLFSRCMKQTSHNHLSTERTFALVTMAMNQAGQYNDAVVAKATS